MILQIILQTFMQVIYKNEVKNNHLIISQLPVYGFLPYQNPPRLIFEQPFRVVIHNQQFVNICHLMKELGELEKFTQPFNQHLNNLTQQDVFKLPNVSFYLGNTKVTHEKLTIHEIHKRSTDYDWLQKTHDYIQWLFPNFHQSRFNSNSFPLTKLEACYFTNSARIGKRMLKSFQIYCNFIGVFVDIDTMEYLIIDPPRAISALKTNTHNHLRIKRILSCLSETGFREIGFKFLEILQNVVRTLKELNKDQFIIDTLENKWKRGYRNETAERKGQISEQTIREHNPSLKQYFIEQNQRIIAQEKRKEIKEKGTEQFKQSKRMQQGKELGVSNEKR